MRTSHIFELTFTRENFRRLKLELLWYRGAYGEPPEEVFQDEDNDNNGTSEGSQPSTTRQVRQ